jgi:hypothetical protein
VQHVLAPSELSLAQTKLPLRKLQKLVRRTFALSRARGQQAVARGLQRKVWYRANRTAKAICNHSCSVLSVSSPPLWQVRIELPPKYTVVRRPQDLHNRKDDRDGQHRAERVAQRRKAGADGASGKKDKECRPCQLEWPTHSQHVAEQKEVSDCEEEDDGERLIEACEQDRGENTQYQYSDIDLRKAKAGAKVHRILHS